jgi:hypothetical protein
MLEDSRSPGSAISTHQSPICNIHLQYPYQYFRRHDDQRAQSKRDAIDKDIADGYYKLAIGEC